MIEGNTTAVPTSLWLEVVEEGRGAVSTILDPRFAMCAHRIDYGTEEMAYLADRNEPMTVIMLRAGESEWAVRDFFGDEVLDAEAIWAALSVAASSDEATLDQLFRLNRGE